MPSTDRPTSLNTACSHQFVSHRHGTLSCYDQDGCRCPECSAARTRYDWARNGRLEERLADHPEIAAPRGEPAFKSPEWVTAMRAGLASAVEAARERDRHAARPGVYG